MDQHRFHHGLPTFLFIIVVMVFLFAFCLVAPLTNEWSGSLQAFAVVGALLISLFALIYAKKEYEYHKKCERTTLLCTYLDRYANTETIRKVICYILDTAVLDEKGNIVGMDPDKPSDSVPMLREKELFMHFFEEIQLQINNGMIDKNDAFDLMGYYCGIFHRVEGYHRDITDYDDERYWKYYLQFARSIPDSLFDC